MHLLSLSLPNSEFQVRITHRLFRRAEKKTAQLRPPASLEQPSPSVQLYERIRNQFIEGRASRVDIRTFIYHGLFHGLQHLSSRDRDDKPIAHNPPGHSVTPSSDALPADIVRQLAALFLTSHSEIAHAR